MTNLVDKLGEKTSTWFKTQYPTAELELVVAHPWARTWKISDQDKVYFLKQVRKSGPQKVAYTEAIASTFPNTVPTVVISKPELSLVVVADHGGTELRSRSKNMSAVLSTYAQLQVDSVNNADQLSCVPQFAIEGLYQKLLSFLASNNEDGQQCAGDYFGELKAQRYHSLFSELTSLFDPIFTQASNLPHRINHCDLRPPNMAKRTDGSIAIFDWDDAKWGPLGLSLHAQFSGCLRPYLALTADLERKTSDVVKTDRKFLDSYIDILASNNLADAESLRKDLPAGIVVGTISYILDFANYPSSSSNTRKAIGRNIAKRLESILDYIDASSHDNELNIRHLANCYFKYSFERRLYKLQKRFERPLIDIQNLNSNALDNSRMPDIFPKVTFSDVEWDNGVCTAENASLAAKIYKEQGVVLLENSLSVELIEECRRYVFDKYQESFESKRPEDSLRVGKKRFMTTLPLEGPFNQSELYANPIIMRIMKQILGDNFILGSMVVVTSLPGSKIQSRHRDHHALFREEELALPPFAVSVMIPLIDMDEEVGATRLFKGSHLQPTDIASKMPGQDPVVPVGSCFLMDYRVQHRGMPNLSKDKIRPVMTLIFQRPWFRDYVNYNHQERMITPKSELDKVPNEHRHLFDWK